MNHRILTIDIETLPAPHANALAHETPAGVELSHAATKNTGLDGDEGRLLCIGFCDEDARGERKPSRGVLGWDRATASFHIDERRTLGVSIKSCGNRMRL